MGEVWGGINLPLRCRRADQERGVDPKGTNDRGSSDRQEEDQSYQQSDDAQEDERHGRKNEVVEQLHGEDCSREGGGLEERSKERSARRKEKCTLPE